MKFIIKITLYSLAALLIVTGLVMLYPLVPGTSSAPDKAFSNYDDNRTQALTRFVKERDTIDALVIASSSDVLFSHGATHEPINTHSARKSLMSILFGMATMSGQVDVSDTLAEIGMDDAMMPLTDIEKSARISDLLKARSGIYIESAGETDDMKASRPRRGQYQPGEHYYYNNWDFNTLGAILTRTTGQSIESHMQTLANRLGFEDFKAPHVYYQKSSGSEHDQYTMFLSARDMARVGQMMLRGGLDTSGQALISPQWIAQSTSKFSTLADFEPFEGYGYLWWLDAETGTYLASGWGGQYLLVDPANDLAIVVRNHTGRRLGALLWRVILNHSTQGRTKDVLALRELLVNNLTITSVLQTAAR